MQNYLRMQYNTTQEPVQEIMVMEYIVTNTCCLNLKGSARIIKEKPAKILY